MIAETEVLEWRELERLLNQVNTQTPTGARNYALLQLMAQTGLRCGEALAVEWRDIRREEWPREAGHVEVWVLRLRRQHTKGKRPRQGIPLASATRAALARWNEWRARLGLRSGPLFCTVSRGQKIHGVPTARGFAPGRARTLLRPGRALNSRYVRQLLRRLADKAGISRRVHPHMLRHTALTDLYDRTHDLRLVQQVAGHATTRMTERYTHVRPIALAEAMGAFEADPC